MMKKELFNLIKNNNYNISIYTEEIFERRCQEEIIRSDEDNSFFVYVEFNFEAIHNILPIEENEKLFWQCFFDAISKDTRGSDILGFLEQDSGVGLLMLDSKINGWTRVRGRIIQAATAYNFDIIQMVLDQTVKPIVYPACIQDIKIQEALEKQG